MLSVKPIPAWLLVASLVASGCGQSAPYPMVKVSGRVLYDDGSEIPAKTIMLRFDSLEPPIDAKTHPRPGMATAGPGGAFDVVTTNQYADGVVRGRHKVKVSATDPAGNPLIPSEYSTSDTPLVVDTADAPFELRVPPL